ncbi:MAG TPA: carbohydrate ABC transporter permease [Victivallales bacterium]|nr:carbohydrate ABC transporter permease [Victivallales bacterium]
MPFFKKRKRLPLEISHKANIIIIIVLGILAFICLYPIVFLFMISISSENSIILHGYQFIPAAFSLNAYAYVFKIGSQLLQSYMITIIVTVVGTAFSVFISSLYAYAISRDDFRYKKLFVFIALIPMLFTAGLVPSYMVNTQLLGFRNSLLGLIVPIAVNSLYIFILRTYFRTSVPTALIEAARIDGAGEFRIFYKIVVPLAMPGIATVALLTAFTYWGNNWYNALLYIDTPSLTPVQAMLMNIQNNMQFIVQNASSLSGQAATVLKNMPTSTARMAIVILATIPIIFAYPFFQKYMVKGLSIGGVKD